MQAEAHTRRHEVGHELADDVREAEAEPLSEHRIYALADGVELLQHGVRLFHEKREHRPLFVLIVKETGSLFHERRADRAAPPREPARHFARSRTYANRIVDDAPHAFEHQTLYDERCGGAIDARGGSDELVHRRVKGARPKRVVADHDGFELLYPSSLVRTREERQVCFVLREGLTLETNHHAPQKQLVGVGRREIERRRGDGHLVLSPRRYFRMSGTNRLTTFFVALRPSMPTRSSSGVYSSAIPPAQSAPESPAQAR